MLKLLKATDPKLAREAQKVEFPDKSVVQVARQMHQVMLANKGCGLAAPQVGVPLKMFVFSDPLGEGVVVNPVIVPTTDGTAEFREGCLSFPGELYATRRARSIWCSYVNEHGEPSGLLRIDGFRAIIFQHETDHLMGKLLPHHGVKVRRE